MRATNRLRTSFRQAEVLELACLNQLFHCACDVFDGHVRVKTVLIEQINRLYLEPLERGLGDLLDMLWPTIQPYEARRPIGIKFEPELGGYHHLPAERSEGFADEFFVGERAVRCSDLSSIPYTLLAGRSKLP